MSKNTQGFQQETAIAEQHNTITPKTNMHQQLTATDNNKLVQTAIMMCKNNIEKTENRIPGQVIFDQQ